MVNERPVIHADANVVDQRGDSASRIRSGRESDETWRSWGTTFPNVPVYRVTVMVAITDDNGKTRDASAVTWCRDHDPSVETDNGRGAVEPSGMGP